MKMRLYGLALCTFGLTAAGTPVVVSSSLTLSAEGRAGAMPSYGGGEQAYLQQQSQPVAAGASNEAVSGSAAWSIPCPSM